MTAATLLTPPPGGSGEYPARLAALRQRMRAGGLAVVAASSPENVYYLTGLDHLGYFAFTMLVVPPSGPPVLVTREMERPTIDAQLPGVTHVTFRDGHRPDSTVAEVISGYAAPGDVIALDDDSLFLPPAVWEGLHRLLPRHRWASASSVLAELRAVKSGTELDATRRAAVVSDTAMRAGLDAARPGVGEADVAAAAYHAMITAGGSQPGFAPLIRPTSILDREHVTWSGRRIESGQGLFLELSGCVERYHAPLARTVYIGPTPPAAAIAAARAERALEAAMRALRPGARTGEVYAAWQHAATQGAGSAAPLRHHCGYLVGIGFPPSWVGGGEVLGIRAGGDTEIRADMAFHLMSWVTEPVGHVVSDTVLVTPRGTELLTTTTRAYAPTR